MNIVVNCYLSNEEQRCALIGSLLVGYSLQLIYECEQYTLVIITVKQ